jgi:hypothetical protein
VSWETQGRQYHAWFGHGTADADGEPHELSAAEIASIVAAGAAASLSDGERAGFQQYLSDGGLKALSEAIPIWAAASKLGGDEFRRVVAGAGLPEVGTAALHDIGRLVAGARGVGDLQAASGRLAASGLERVTRWLGWFDGEFISFTGVDATLG